MDSRDLLATEEEVRERNTNLRLNREAIAVRLDELRAGLPVRFETQDRSREQYPLSEPPSCVTILGDRGSGKTTLLFSVCRDLVQKDHDLVLPPMQPELFSANESVISAFLAGLWAMYVDGEGLAGDAADTDSDLIRMLTSCARSFAASRTTEAALAHASDSTIDFAEDAVAISRSGARLPFQLRQLAQRLCMDPEKGPRLMVVPIDDPDMSPLTVKAILRDLRVLGSIPGVVPIAAFCEDDLSRDWLDERKPETPKALAEASEQYERQTEKLFPYRARFEVQPLAVADRIEFSPLGEAEPLREKLATLRRALEVDGHVWPIDEIFGEMKTYFGIPNPLPSNPRMLVQAWNLLDQVDKDPSRNSRDLLARLVAGLLVLFTVPLRASLGPSIGRRFYQIEGAPSSEISGKARIFVNLEDTQLYAAPITEISGVEDPQGVTSIKLRKVGKIDAVKATPSTGPETRAAALPPAATASLLAFHELAFGSGLFAVKNDICRVERSDWRNMQEVEMAGLATDDWFLALSEATTLSEVIKASEDWNEIAAMVEEGCEVRDLFTAAVRVTLAATGSELESGSDCSYEEAFEQATEFYLAHKDREDRVSKRFCNWYEFDLPMQWHSAIFNPGLLRKYCERYREAAKSAFHRDTTDEWRNPRDFIDSRWAQILDVISDDSDRNEHCWLAGYFELASALESTKLEELVELSPFWRERTAAQQAGSRLAGEALNRATGKHRLAPYSTPEGYDLFVRARQALRKRSAAALRSASRSGRR